MNRMGNSALYRIVKDLEHQHGKRANTNHEEVIREVLGEVSFTGFPICLPYTDTDAVLSAVRSTQLHRVTDPHAEFCLSVHIDPYPGGVLALWVYIAAVIKCRNYHF